jgi:hypothetical protein
MARFPEAQAEIFALTRQMIGGMRTMGGELADSPYSADELQERLDRADASAAAAVQAETVLRARYAARSADIAAVVEGDKAVLAWAEIVFRKTPEKLAGLGWGTRRPRRALSAPREVRDIVVVSQGPGWVKLKWKQPKGGGKVATYEIQRRQGSGSWDPAGVATNPEAILSQQPSGVPLEFQVVAINKAGEGAPSGVVTVML